jgi:N6-L-threonylcarbamoyladenine synthase
MRREDEAYCLGIESSCDETAVALTTREGRARVSLVASQVDLHARFGGVVPEVAARMHVQACLPLVEQAMAEADATWDRVERVAVTYAPGLIGCLLVGLETAKALAWLHGKPLVAVDHLAAHVHAIYVNPTRGANLLFENGESFNVLPTQPDIDHPFGEAEGQALRVEQPRFPHVGLIVSGGHALLARVIGPGQIERLASTRDDAPGEAYDKVARVAGLGYPGGPVIDRLAAEGDPAKFPFATPMARRDRPDFSFSGLKTAVGREIERQRAESGGPAIPDQTLKDLCAGFQHAVVESLMTKAMAALADVDGRDLVIAGGVACNRGLRRRAAEATRRRRGTRAWFPSPSLCTDNAAMIAGLGWRLAPLDPQEALALNARSSAPR